MSELIGRQRQRIAQRSDSTSALAEKATVPCAIGRTIALPRNQRSGPQPLRLPLRPKTVVWQTDPCRVAACLRDPHTAPQFAFAIYHQIATHRYGDLPEIWALLRFPGEPEQPAGRREIRRGNDPNPPRPIRETCGSLSDPP
jgi:hypothetical protein